MSSLEQLARQRAQRNNNSSDGGHFSLATTTKSAALLGKLKGSLRQRQQVQNQNPSQNQTERGVRQIDRNNAGNQGSVSSEKRSLADQLKQIQQQRRSAAVGNKSSGLEIADNTTSDQLPKPASFSMKLQSLKLRRQSQGGDTSLVNETDVSHNKPFVSEINGTRVQQIQDTLLTEIDRIKRDMLQFERLRSMTQFSTDSIAKTTTSTSVGAEVKSIYSNFLPPLSSIQPFNNDNRVNFHRKRNRDLFTVYFPRDYAKRTKLIHNFGKLSPDGVILMAQASAFETVTHQVSKLSIDKMMKRRRRRRSKSSMSDVIPKLNIREYLRTNDIRPTMTVITLGHTGSGKTSILGKLLIDLNLFKISQINELKIALERAKLDESEYLSWVLDYEDKNTVTKGRDNTHQRTFKIKVTSADSTSPQTQAFKLLDRRRDNNHTSSPQFLMDFVNADVAILVVNCATDAFEASFNLNGQILEHCILARCFGIPKLIIALNQLDTVGWYSGRYMDIKRELALFLKKLGYDNRDLYWIPCCPFISGPNDGIYGQIDKKLCPWFERQLLENSGDASSIFGVLRDLYPEICSTTKYRDIMDALGETSDASDGNNTNNNSNSNDDSDSDNERNFILTVEDYSTSTSTVTGTINSGCIQKGTVVTTWPASRQYIVEKVLLNGTKTKSHGNYSTEETPLALIGDCVTLKLRSLDDVTDEDESMGDESSEITSDTRLGLCSGDIVATPDVDVVSVSKKSIALEVALLNTVYDLPETALEVGNQYKICRGCFESVIKIDRIVGKVGDSKSNCANTVGEGEEEEGSTSKILVEAKFVSQSHLRPIPLVREDSSGSRLNNIILRNSHNRTIGSVKIIL